MLKTTNQRVLGLCAGFFLLFGVLWGRCAWLQVIGAGRLAALARAQHRVSRPILPQRGTIYDRNGQVLAMSVPVPS
ncbi:MAG: hypothetical protein HYZ89_06575, partial [Candidatus Omnitrophica bacterium]|nr:hypothetical protein [Candidatus Omnitrophota bacterium]